MSRPYVNINSASYNGSTDVISMDITALRLRGQSTIEFGGFSQSVVLNLTDGRYLSNETTPFTFSANINGSTASGNGTNTTYTSATREFTLSGTATPGTNVKLTLWGLNGALTGNFVVFGAGGYTFSSTQSATTAAATLFATASFLPNGVTKEISGNTITFVASENTGAFYNGNVARLESSSLGTLGFTFSPSYYTSTWGGGVTTLTIPVSSDSFGQLDDLVFNITGTNDVV